MSEALRVPLRVPPHNLDAEQSLLGSLLIDNAAFDEIAELLTEADFYHDHHRRIWRHVARLIESGKPADVLTVDESIRLSDDRERAGGQSYLVSLAGGAGSARNIRRYAEIVREHSIRRHLIALCSDTADRVWHTGEDIATLMDVVEQQLFELRKTRGSQGVEIRTLLSRIMEACDRKFQRGEETLAGTSTGFIDLDQQIDGLEPADLIIVAGRPSMGKTALAMNIAEHIAVEQKLPVLVFSLEMSDEALAQRMLGSISRVDQQAIKRGRLTDDDWHRLTRGVAQLADAPIIIEETAGLSLGDLKARARRAMRRHGKLGAIIVDYLQLMSVPDAENRNLAIGAASQGLKSLAKELSLPVLALSQLNRELEKRANRRPLMSDLRDSGTLEQDADKILFMYRDEVYNPATTRQGIAEVIVGKNRNGPTGTAYLAWLGKFTRFENYAGELPDEGPQAPRNKSFQKRSPTTTSSHAY